jgi:heparin binding hemagglutinin HbhA
MPTLPTNEEWSKAREQAAQAIGGAVEQARTPLMAALGASDLATQTLRDTLGKVRTRLNEGAESAKAGVNDLPTDLGGLRERLDTAELRKRVDDYTQSAWNFYSSLADRGETTFDKLRSQPQFQRAWSQVETAQGRVNGAVEDMRGLADEMLGRVSRTTRSVGEKAAQTTERFSAGAADAIRDTGEQASEGVKEQGAKAATTARRTARKAASQTSSAKSTSTGGKSRGTSQSKNQS